MTALWTATVRVEHGSGQQLKVIAYSPVTFGPNRSTAPFLQTGRAKSSECFFVRTTWTPKLMAFCTEQKVLHGIKSKIGTTVMRIERNCFSFWWWLVLFILVGRVERRGF